MFFTFLYLRGTVFVIMAIRLNMKLVIPEEDSVIEHVNQSIDPIKILLDDGLIGTVLSLSAVGHFLSLGH